MITLSARTRRVIVHGVKTDGSTDQVLAVTRSLMVCTPRQARVAMAQTPYGQGTLLQAAEAAISQADEALQIAWEYGTEWQRLDPAIEQIGAALGLTDTQIDALFARAMTL
jgi:hypothetical protein